MTSTRPDEILNLGQWDPSDGSSPVVRRPPRGDQARQAVLWRRVSQRSETIGDRLDELKGKVKKGISKLTGNERLEAEGDAEADAAKAQRETKGAIRQAGGKVKEAMGDLIGNERLEAGGKADQLRGRADRLD